ncbi:hypothetical protein GQ457_13G004450 [Hibiscus cannabinus]
MKGCWFIPSYLVLFFLFLAYNSSALSQSPCPHDQSHALIQFVNSFSIDCSSYNSRCNVSGDRTFSWKKGTNCCLWDGVKCDTETGNVVGLDLSCSCLAGSFPSNSTLFLLRHLRQLNLAWNDFNSSLMESKFGELTSLTHLNISGAGFEGKIPLEISHLSKLLSLDLSDNYGLVFEEHVFGNVVGNLTQLRHLLLSEVNMSLVEPTSFLNMSSYITTLILEDNELHGKFPEDVFRFPYLEEFRVSRNDLELKLPQTSWNAPLRSLQVPSSSLQELPDSIGNLTSLEILDFSDNNLRGPIPATLGNLKQLRYLDLSSNNLVGNLPSQVRGPDRNFLSSSLFSLPHLVVLRLNNNKLTGPIDQFDKAAPLEVVDLSNNEIHGPIPASFSQLVNLNHLDLSNNNLSGSFELDKLSKFNKLEVLSFSNNALLSLTSAGNANYSLPNLVELDLSSCNTSEFPNFVRNLPGLTHLYLSYNRIHVLEANMFAKLKRLYFLDLSHNSPLSLSNINNLTLVLPNLTFLYMSSCNITEFSNFLTTQENLDDLDLSNNLIQGRITEQGENWGSNLHKLLILDLSGNLLTALEGYPWKNIVALKLSSNRLEGPLLVPPPSMSAFSISKNRLYGEIPSAICNFGCSEYDVVLDLSNNNFSGEIPECLGSTFFTYLDLQMNNFHGNIPSFCVKENQLRTLNLNNNDFAGSVPKSLANCEYLEVLNLGNNKINDTFPHWLRNLPQLQVLVLRSNQFHGPITHPYNQSHFATLRILDLSHNEFSGFLPTTYFKSFQGMMSLDYFEQKYMGDRFNYYDDYMVLTVKGVDTELQKILTIFTAIDMSSNKFQGTIPEMIGKLASLQVLNFSHNHLTGHIPSSLGNVSALESLDLSCNKLIGEIPSELTDLLFLEVLNLSENRLVGLIPQGKQFNTFLNDSYRGNTGLCGFPVSKGCGQSEHPVAGFYEQEADSAFRLDWRPVIMGYGCGVVFGFSAGYIMMTIRKPKWLVGMVQRAGNKVLGRFKKYR